MVLRMSHKLKRVSIVPCEVISEKRCEDFRIFDPVSWFSICIIFPVKSSHGDYSTVAYYVIDRICALVKILKFRYLKRNWHDLWNSFISLLKFTSMFRY